MDLGPDMQPKWVQLIITIFNLNFLIAKILNNYATHQTENMCVCVYIILLFKYFILKCKIITNKIMIIK